MGSAVTDAEQEGDEEQDHEELTTLTIRQGELIHMVIVVPSIDVHVLSARSQKLSGSRSLQALAA